MQKSCNCNEIRNISSAKNNIKMSVCLLTNCDKTTNKKTFFSEKNVLNRKSFTVKRVERKKKLSVNKIEQHKQTKILRVIGQGLPFHWKIHAKRSEWICHYNSHYSLFLSKSIEVCCFFSVFPLKPTSTNGQTSG